MDIKLQAYVRRLKGKASPPVTVPAVTATQATNGPTKATVGNYDPDTDKLQGALPTGELVLMEPLTNGSVAIGQQVIYSDGYYHSMPTR